MSKDVECPYCEEWQEIDHDDGYGYDESCVYEQQCADCKKNFAFTTSISFYYDAEQADCLNGAEHNWQELSKYMMKYYPGSRRCQDCDKEERGKYVNPSDD